MIGPYDVYDNDERNCFESRLKRTQRDNKNLNQDDNEWT